MTEKNKRDYRKPFVILLALFALFGTISGGIAAYWAESINDPDNAVVANNTVTVGTAKAIKGELEVTQEFAVTEHLVPTGMTSKSVGTVVEEFTKDISAKWKDTTNVVKRADNVTGTLSIVATPEFVDPADTPNNALLQQLVTANVTYTNGQTITLQGDAVPARVRVTMAEPATKADYLKVKGKAIKIKLTYSVAQ